MFGRREQTRREELVNSATHGVAVALSIAALTVLVVFSSLQGDPWKIVGFSICLLYTSDAADDLLCVDFGGRRIIKQKTK